MYEIYIFVDNLKDKVNNKTGQHRNSITRIAKQFDGRSRYCQKCPIDPTKLSYEASIDICLTVCSNAYVRGFKKGVKYERQNKTK